MNRTTFWRVMCVVNALLLAGCGGGGHGTAAPLAFESTGTVQKSYGDPPFTYPATGGSGNISYRSSNPGVASVDSASGTVTITAAGSATITATDSAGHQIAYTLIVNKASQSINLSSSTLDSIVGRPVAAPLANATGAGAVSYVSSNPALISVDATTGSVTPLAVGSATITVSEAGSQNYNAAQATFTVSAIAQAAVLDSWIGTANSLVTAVPALPGVGFYRSTSGSCVLAQYASCPDGQLNIFAEGAVTDTAVTAQQAGYYWLQWGSYVSGPIAVSATSFTARSNANLATLNNRLFLVGGYNPSQRMMNDVWSSTNGVTWTQLTPAASFSKRQSAALATYNGQLWLIGGYDGTQLLNDVWVSSDGISWTERTVSAGFFGLFEHSTGGVSEPSVVGWWIDASGMRNDVWSTSDGVTWTLATGSAAFSPRSQTAIAPLGSSLFLVGGLTVMPPTISGPPRMASTGYA